MKDNLRLSVRHELFFVVVIAACTIPFAISIGVTSSTEASASKTLVSTRGDAMTRARLAPPPVFGEADSSKTGGDALCATDIGCGVPAFHLISETEVHKRMAAAIDAQARAQCGGQDRDDAQGCWLTALWGATQCPAASSYSVPAGPQQNAPRQLRPPDVDATAKPCEASGDPFPISRISIKPATYFSSYRTREYIDDNGYHLREVGFFRLIEVAYSMGPFVVVKGIAATVDSGPESKGEAELESAQVWDIDANFVPGVTDAVKKLSLASIQLVVAHWQRFILQEGFGLDARVEITEVPGFDLVIAENGPKLKLATRKNSSSEGRLVGGYEEPTSDAITMAEFACQLSEMGGKPINDKTGLMAEYHVTLSPDWPFQHLGLDLQHLGLGLVPSTGVATIVTVQNHHKPLRNWDRN
jgi:uncharacterized protein (TIGR03435 family)